MAGWEKLGLVLKASGTRLSQSHAMLPTPFVMHDRIRVYFASCDGDLRGRVFRADVSLHDPRQIIEIDSEPVLDLGAPGDFDADGVNPSQVIERDGKLYLYYIGWQRLPRADVPYTLLTGIAISSDGGRRFHRLSNLPALSPLPTEELFRTAPHVFYAGTEWVMLYIGGGSFIRSSAGRLLPTYDLRIITSRDGIGWPGSGKTLLSPRRESGEIGFGRPTLWHNSAGAALFISVRTSSGYSLVTLENASEVQRRELLGRSVGGWDSEMVCFGAPCITGPCEYLFYNGNQFGRSGFGVARREACPKKNDDALVLISRFLR